MNACVRENNIDTFYVDDWKTCRQRCELNPDCVAVEIRTSSKLLCQLSSGNSSSKGYEMPCPGINANLTYSEIISG